MARRSFHHASSRPNHHTAVRHLVHKHGDQYWSFVWGPGDEELLIEEIKLLANDPRAPLDWVEAALICTQVQQQGSAGLITDLPPPDSYL